jgi:peptidoglycan hydrolase CwlO-like protein|tara:strand:+ start:3066 stop:3389 length:324 start_codon:yes stop_codon:yes gene_type:complete
VDGNGDLIRLLIAIGGAIAALAGAWYAVKYNTKANTTRIETVQKEFNDALGVLQDRVHSLGDQVKAQWAKSDETSVETQKFETTIKWLRSDINKLQDQELWRTRNGK